MHTFEAATDLLIKDDLSRARSRRATTMVAFSLGGEIDYSRQKSDSEADICGLFDVAFDHLELIQPPREGCGVDIALHARACLSVAISRTLDDIELGRRLNRDSELEEVVSVGIKMTNPDAGSTRVSSIYRQAESLAVSALIAAMYERAKNAL